jgi:hypothetical protein
MDHLVYGRLPDDPLRGSPTNDLGGKRMPHVLRHGAEMVLL